MKLQNYHSATFKCTKMLIHPLQPSCDAQDAAICWQVDQMGHTSQQEAPTKRTMKHARRTKKQRVPGRTYRWVENCLEAKPSLDAQVSMRDCGSDILVGSRKDNLLDSSRCAYPCLSIAVPAAIKNRAIGNFWLGCILRLQ